MLNLTFYLGGHRLFDHQIGGHKNIVEVLLEIHDLIPMKVVSPYVL